MEQNINSTQKLILKDVGLTNSFFNKRTKVISFLKLEPVKINFSVLASSETSLIKEIIIAKNAGVDRIHLDYIDGEFTPGLKPYDCTKQISKIHLMGIPLDVHLMANNPSTNLIETLIAKGLKPHRDRIFIHYESVREVEKLSSLIKFISEKELKVGLVINPETEIESLRNSLELSKYYLDSIVVMVTIPGAGSRPFIEESIGKVKFLKELLSSLAMDENVSVISDGGLNDFSLKSIIESGVNEIVVRSWLLKDSNFSERVRIIKNFSIRFLESVQLKDMMNKWGLSSYKYLVEAIVLFCKGDNTFTKEEIIKSITHLDGVNKIIINDERVVDIFYPDKLLRFHKKDIVPIEHLGLKERTYFDGICVKIYTNNVINKTKGDYILGISGSWHDSTAALIREGKVIAALEEERMTRIKHDDSLFPLNSIKRLLEYEKIGWEDIKHISIGWDFNLYVDTPNSINPNQEFFNKIDEDFYIKNGISKNSLIRRRCCERNKFRFDISRVYGFLDEMAKFYKSEYEPRVSFVRHTKSHVASAYYLSGFKERVLTIALDGYGDLESGSVWVGENEELKELTKFELPHSLGWVYAAITEYLGFRPTCDEGQVMGLAPYGEPWNSLEMQRVNSLQELFKEFIKFDSVTQKLQSNPEFYYYGEIVEGKIRITKLLQKKLSELGIYPTKRDVKCFDPYNIQDRPYANLAFALQERTSQIVYDIVRFYLRENIQTRDINKLALAGGIAFNILANGKLISDRLVYGENIFIQPAAGDSGTSIGAALTIAKEIYNDFVLKEMEHAYLGPDYSESEIKKILDDYLLKENVDYVRVDNNELIKRASEYLKNTIPIAWFQGRSEVGPRALGNRSIFLNLNDVQANNRANKIKARQPWRPSALSITEEDAYNYFRGIGKSPFMTISFPILYGKQKVVLSGIHKFGDRLARPQTVSKKQNSMFWNLLKRLDDIITIPAVVNTSFNKQEPLVENPEEALNTFFYMDGVNKLFMGNFIINKKNLRPRIISLQEEICENRISYDIFKKILEKFPNCHKIIIGNNEKEILIPLVKDVFFGHLKEDVLTLIAKLINNFSLENDLQELKIKSTSKKMQEIIFSNISKKIDEMYKERDYEILKER